MTEIVRKLATIEKILAINPIPGADAIEVADVRGWSVVVEKNKFKINDLVIYVEIDSVMPERPEFEFLANKKYRIKTMKLRGQVSQGIVFPLDILMKIPESGMAAIKERIKDSNVWDAYFDDGSMQTLVEGMDFTEELGIEKYEYPIPAELSGKVIGAFPSHSVKTDEERMQNLMDDWDSGVFHKYRWFETEKLDGSSATLHIYDNVFGISSRNLQLHESESNSFWKVAREWEIEEKMRKYMSDHGLQALTLQGELIGEGIQKNKYKLKGQDIRFFRSFNPMEFKFFSYSDFLASMIAMGLSSVPIVEADYQLPEKFEDLLLHVQGRSRLYDTAREGSVFVAKNAREENDRGRLSFKVISNKFLLKHGE